MAGPLVAGWRHDLGIEFRTKIQVIDSQGFKESGTVLAPSTACALWGRLILPRFFWPAEQWSGLSQPMSKRGSQSENPGT